MTDKKTPSGRAEPSSPSDRPTTTDDTEGQSKFLNPGTLVRHGQGTQPRTSSARHASTHAQKEARAKGK